MKGTIYLEIYNSPAYLEKKKKEAFAMICQLKMPVLFISQSAAETKWPEFLRALGQTVDIKTYTDTEIAQMDFETKSRLIRGDSATLVRYFDHQFNVFLKDVIFSKYKPIGEITDYFWRKEFAMRDAIHVHWFACVKDAPVYGEVPNSEIAVFYDKIISCSSDVPEDHKEYIQHQIHRHSRSCRVGKARSCRFGFPKPLMDKSCVLQTFTCEEQEDNDRGKELWIHVKRLLNSYGLGTETTDTFEAMLEQLNMSHDDYILVKSKKIMIEEKSCGYMLRDC